MPELKKPQPQTVLRWLATKPAVFWDRLREENAVALFRKVAAEVPAYRDFLKKNRIDPSKVKTFLDFQNVPPVSKANYLRVYPWDSLMWQGDIRRPYALVATSGSTGDPFYFPRTESLEYEYSILTDMFLSQAERSGPTLVIICLGMGVWIGGVLTYKAFELSSRRSNLPLSIIAPGVNKPEVFNALRRLAPLYTQTILVGYPPLLKDILDAAPAAGVDLKKLNLRLLSAAEAFSENFRDYLAQAAHLKNVYRDTLNIYGTADIGAMAWETPTAILVRRLAMRHPKLFAGLFSNITKTPTLAQYNPLFMTFEAPGGDILLTGNSAMPLVRYAIGDHGGVHNFEQVAELVQGQGLDLASVARRSDVPHLCRLPFVYVYERSDFSVVLSGANIYPEEVREPLQKKPLSAWFTSKFTMLIQSDARHNVRLEINLELRPGIRSSRKLISTAGKLIVANLLRRNSEYASNYRSSAAQSTPRLVLWPYEDPTYFKPGIKQKWVKK